MCGILGWSGPAAPSFDLARFNHASTLLNHRGPDDQGLWAADGILLGHRRLSIIDLSAAGHQPMVSASGGSVIAFNGEIYNFVELRESLLAAGVQLQGASDTRVLLELVELQGVAAVGRLNGMFAFAIWDTRRRQLLLCRDRFGVKPLYYCMGPDGIAFASEPKALLALYPQHRRLDRNTLLRFLAHNQLYCDDHSFYDGIGVLPGGHYAVYDARTHKLDIKRFWDYPDAHEIDHTLSPAQACEQFAALLDDAVRIRLRSDVPVGITLSGGLDSTAILAAGSRHAAHPLRCFTSIYGEGSGDAAMGELDWARLASDAVGATLTPVPAERGDWLQVMSEVVWHMDGPGYSPAVYPLWRLMQRARRENVPVLLEGQGADEELAGYPQYAVLELLNALGRGEWREPGKLVTQVRGLAGTFTWRWALAWLARESMPGLLAAHRRRAGFHSLVRRDVVLPEAPAAFPVRGDRLDTRLRQDHARDILPGLLHYGDAISMAHSIESRHPFLDYRLVEWLFRAPSAIKLRDGQTKWVLREYLRSHGQAAIGNRRDKKGYPTPAQTWLASEEGRHLEAMMLNPASPLLEWCDPKKLARLFGMNRRGVMGTEHHLYKLASTQIWMDRCLRSQGAET